MWTFERMQNLPFCTAPSKAYLLVEKNWHPIYLYQLRGWLPRPGRNLQSPFREWETVWWLWCSINKCPIYWWFLKIWESWLALGWLWLAPLMIPSPCPPLPLLPHHLSSFLSLFFCSAFLVGSLCPLPIFICVQDKLHCCKEFHKSWFALPAKGVFPELFFCLVFMYINNWLWRMLLPFCSYCVSLSIPMLPVLGPEWAE